MIRTIKVVHGSTIVTGPTGATGPTGVTGVTGPSGSGGGVGQLAPVAVATTGDIDLATGGIPDSSLTDGADVEVGQRVLVWQQNDATEAGIYIVQSGAWTRATDLPSMYPDGGGGFIVGSPVDGITVATGGAGTNFYETAFMFSAGSGAFYPVPGGANNPFNYDIGEGIGTLDVIVEEANSVGGVSTPEDVTNKSTDPAFTANSNTLYPSQKAVKSYLNIIIPTAIEWGAAGLKFWLDASLLSLSDNDPLTSGDWTDLSGFGFDVDTVDPGHPPIFKQAIQNGLGVVRYDGANTIVECSSRVLADEELNTIIVVAKQTSKDTTGNLVSFNGTGENFSLNSVGNNGFLRMFAGLPISDAIDHSGAFHVFTGIFNQASSKGFVDGALVVSGDTGTPGNMSLIEIGSDGLATNLQLTGDIGEVLVFNSVLTNAQRINIETILKAKWATP